MKKKLFKNRKPGRRATTIALLAFSAVLLFQILPAWAGKLDTALNNNGVLIKESSDKYEKKYKEDEILIKFKADVSEESKQKLHRKHGSEKINEFPSLHIHQVKLKKGLIVEIQARDGLFLPGSG